MKNEFTIKNLFTFWIKIWPITAVLLIIGGVLGFMSFKSTTPAFETSSKLLIIPKNNAIVASDYTALIQGDSVLGVLTSDENEDNSSCSLAATNSGNIITLTTTCATLEEAKNFDKLAVELSTEIIGDTYTDSIKDISLIAEAKDPENTVGLKDKLSNLAIPVIAAILCSAIIAFVGLDIKISSKNKK